jgi:DNA-cytosine methyltransferase
MPVHDWKVKLKGKNDEWPKTNVKKVKKVKNDTKAKKNNNDKSKQQKKREKRAKQIKPKKPPGKEQTSIKQAAACVAADLVENVANKARRANSPEPPAKDDMKLLVGSDCSGYGSEFIALTMLQVNATLVFVAEKNDADRDLLRAVHHDVDFSKVIVYHNIRERDNNSAPYVDLFVSGAPCQPWPQAGEQLGLEDLHKRGAVIFHSLEYVICKRPKVVIIENKKGLAHANNKTMLECIVGILKDFGYCVEWKILNTKDNGIPHFRPRLYIVAVRCRYLHSSIEFPQSIARADFEQFINVDNCSAEPMPKSQWFRDAVDKAKKKWGETALNGSWLVIAMTSSKTYSNSMINCIPCITTSRGRHIPN